MSQRRMFSPDIVRSDEFISMPISCQALYFHLGMEADDDGFVQPKIIMRSVGFNDDDLKVLVSKRFLLAFAGGVVVIKHWLIHNMIRHDRYKPTRFSAEKSQLFIKENKAYTDTDPLGCHLVANLAPQVRLGKVRLGENTVPTGTPSIKLGNEIYTMEELQYINEEEMHEDEYLEEGEKTRTRLKNKKDMLKMGRRDNKYGPKVMAVMARHFAKCAGVEITDVFDASPWMRPISAIYRYFGKDADKAMLFMTRAIGFFEEKNLSYNPQTLHDNLPLIDKWIEKNKSLTSETDQDVSSRRRL